MAIQKRVFSKNHVIPAYAGIQDIHYDDCFPELAIQAAYFFLPRDDERDIIRGRLMQLNVLQEGCHGRDW